MYTYIFRIVCSRVRGKTTAAEIGVQLLTAACYNKRHPVEELKKTFTMYDINQVTA